MQQKRTAYFTLLTTLLLVFLLLVVIAITRWWGNDDGDAGDATFAGSKDLTGAQELPALAVASQDTVSLAKFFLENWGTWSAQGDFHNVTNLKPLMTPAMQVNADDYIMVESQRRPRGLDAPFYIIQTEVQDLEMVSEEAGRKVYQVILQRLEAGVEIEGERGFEQVVQIQLEQIDGEWLVAGLESEVLF